MGPCSICCRRWEACSEFRRKSEREPVNAAENWPGKMSVKSLPLPQRLSSRIRQVTSIKYSQMSLNIHSSFAEVLTPDGI